MKLVPKRRFKGFSAPWGQFKLNDIGDIVTGSTPPTNDPSNYGGEYPFITPVDIKGARYIKRTNTTLSKKGFLMSRALKEGAILFVSIGSTIGKVAQTKGVAVTNQQINAILVNDSICDDFIYSLIEFEAKKIRELAATQAVPILNKTTFSMVKLHLPQLEEQKKMGKYFANLDNLIAIQHIKLKKLQAMKQAYLHEMFPAEGESVPKRRFEGFTGEWKIQELGEIAQITMGQSPSSNNYTNNPSDHILVQGNLDMKNNRVCPRIWTKQVTKKANKGDIILTVRAPVGDVGKTNYDVVLGRGVAGIKGNEFLFQLLIKLKVNDFWSNLSTGSTFDSINSDDIRTTEVLIPTIEEQQKIGSFFRKLDERIALQQAKVEKLKAMKQAYLHEMFV